MYRGYMIYEMEYCWEIISPDGDVWTEDTLDDAYDAIDEDVAIPF